MDGLMKIVTDPAELAAAMAGGPSAVLFTASWCPFCRAFRPIFERFAGNDRHCTPVIAEIDDEDNPLWERWHIAIVPSVLFFDRGALVRRLDGRAGVGLDERQLQAALAQL
jgi:thioredoxin 1